MEKRRMGENKARKSTEMEEEIEGIENKRSGERT